MKKRDIVITCIVLFWAIAVHNSHFIIVFILLLIYTIVFIFSRFRQQKSAIPLTGKKLIIPWGVLLFSWLFICTVNFSLNAGFTLSRSGSVFLVTRLNEMGLLQPYLKENCMKHHYKLCEYKDSLPANFMWDYLHSPFYKCGGWSSQQVRDEYNAITRDMLTTPKYGHLFLVKATESGIKQFFCFSTGDAPPQREESPTYCQILVHYTESLQEYLGSHQNTQTLNFFFLNEVHKYSICLFLFLSLAFLFYPFLAREYKWIILFILAGLMVNAFICGAFSTVSERYQSRVVWLVPLPLFLIIANKELFLEKLRKMFS